MPAPRLIGSLPPGPRPGARRAGWREVEFAALDFETTGLDYRRDVVVSFGVVPLRQGRVVVGESTGRLVRPDVPPSPASQTIHELRPQDLAEAPPIAEVRQELAGALARRFVLAWFDPVEVAFLAGIFGGAWRWRRRVLDVQRLAVALERKQGKKTGGGYALAAVAERYGVPVTSPHDALEDALVTAQLFLVLATRLERVGFGTVDRLTRLARSSPRP